MHRAIREWRRVLAPGAQVVLVVGNVRFEGYMLPVDLILSEMAEAEGFQIVEIIVTRHKNNSAQQMARFGRFPARESILFWKKPALTDVKVFHPRQEHPTGSGIPGNSSTPIDRRSA